MDKNRLRNAILNATSRNAALVIKNANIVNVFTGTIEKGDVAVRDGIILGIGTYSGREEIDAEGAFLCPGLIDGHVHIESSMAHPLRFAECVLKQGTTTVIADPTRSPTSAARTASSTCWIRRSGSPSPCSS